MAQRAAAGLDQADATADLDMSLEEFRQFLQWEAAESRKLAKELGLVKR